MTASPPSRTSALGGVRILDLTSVVFGPYASQILADYGADVIKVEAPAGDSTRHTGPAQEPGLAVIFLGLNRNKRSIVLDLKQAAARQALLTMADQADVLMHSMRPAKMAALGLDPDTLCGRNPRLVYAGLYGFGAGGAYDGRPAYDDIIQGLSGLADLVDRQTGAPRYLPTVAADKTCGLIAAHAILAALFQRERTGAGQQLEVPMFESMASYALVEHYYGRHLADEPGEAGYPRVLTPWRRPCKTADGHVCLMPYTDAHWRDFFIAAERPIWRRTHALPTSRRARGISKRCTNCRPASWPDAIRPIGSHCANGWRSPPRPSTACRTWKPIRTCEAWTSSSRSKAPRAAATAFPATPCACSIPKCRPPCRRAWANTRWTCCARPAWTKP